MLMRKLKVLGFSRPLSLPKAWYYSLWKWMDFFSFFVRSDDTLYSISFVTLKIYLCIFFTSYGSITRESILGENYYSKCLISRNNVKYFRKNVLETVFKVGSIILKQVMPTLVSIVK